MWLIAAPFFVGVIGVIIGVVSSMGEVVQLLMVIAGVVLVDRIHLRVLYVQPRQYIPP